MCARSNQLVLLRHKTGRLLQFCTCSAVWWINCCQTAPSRCLALLCTATRMQGGSSVTELTRSSTNEHSLWVQVREYCNICAQHALVLPHVLSDSGTRGKFELFSYCWACVSYFPHAVMHWSMGAHQSGGCGVTASLLVWFR